MVVKFMVRQITWCARQRCHNILTKDIFKTRIEISTFINISGSQFYFTRRYNEGAFVAAKEPFVVELEGQKRYSWCSCGRSKKQPFCDGSHKKTGLSPLRFKLDEQELKVLCGCKMTGTAPYCDGTHLTDMVKNAEIGQPCEKP